MISLPYNFDTASTWQRIVKIAATVIGFIVLSIVGAALTGQWTATAGLTACLLIFCFMLRVARAVPMGAAGQITRSEVIVSPVKALGYSLRVPVGSYPITQFRTVTLEQRVVVVRPPNTRDNEDIGSVCLEGPNGSPKIEVARTSISAATIVARDLSAVLGLELREVAAPGSRVVRVQLGA